MKTLKETFLTVFVLIAASGLMYKAAAHGIEKCQKLSINYEQKRSCLGI